MITVFKIPTVVATKWRLNEKWLYMFHVFNERKCINPHKIILYAKMLRNQYTTFVSYDVLILWHSKDMGTKLICFDFICICKIIRFSQT